MQQYLDLAPHQTAYSDAKLLEADNAYLDATEGVLAVIHQIEERARAFAAPRPAGGGGGGGGNVKAQETLKPPVLERDATPVEFTEWKRAYRAYHSASKFGTLSVL